MFSGVLSLNTQFTESILSFNRIKFKREVLYELKEVYIYCWQLSQFDSIDLEWPKLKENRICSLTESDLTVELKWWGMK